MRRGPITTTLAATLLLGGCADILGFPDYEPGSSTTTSETTTSAGGSGGTGTTSSTSGTTSSSSTSSTSSMGGGGSGGAPPMICQPGTTVTCYSGPPETIGIAGCKSGVKTCSLDGTSYGPCAGEVPPAAEQCATTADESCDGIASCTGQLRFGRSFGDAAEQHGNAVAANARGRVAVAGSVQGSVDFGGGATTGSTDDDAFVAVYGPKGQYLWSRRFGDASQQNITAVAVEPNDNVVVAGWGAGAIDFGDGVPKTATGTDGLVAKYDPTGKLLWAKLLGDTGADAAVNAVAVASDGTVLAAGQHNGTLTIPGCPTTLTAAMSDAFVARFRADGLCEWLVGFGAASNDTINAMTIDTGGNVLIAGSYSDATLAMGATMLPNAGGIDTFVANIAFANGSVTWATSFTGPAEQSPWGIAAAPSGEVWVVGRTVGMTDFGGGFTHTPTGVDAWVVKLSPTGTTALARPFGGANADYGQSLAVDGAGNAVIGVNSNGALAFEKAYTSLGNFDAFVAKLDATDAHVIWTRQLGDVGYQALFGVAVDGGGNVLVTGYNAGTFDLGGAPLQSAGANDVFILGLAP